MAPRGASTRRGATATATASSSSSASTSQPSTSWTSTPLVELNILQHINGIRQVPNFVAFDTFAQSTATDWMEGMLAQARDIRKQWCSEYIANTTRDQRGSQASRIAGEMLKTPSRRRAATVRTQGSRATSRKVPKETLSHPLHDSEDKENAPATGIAPPKPSTFTEPPADASSNSVGAARGTRSRADKAQIAKLPNPFQAKLTQHKAKATNGFETADVGPTPVADPEEEAEREATLPKAKTNGKQKAATKTTKKQQTVRAKKQAASSEPVELDEEGEHSTVLAAQRKAKGKVKAKQQEAQPAQTPDPTVEPELPPTLPSLSVPDESMEVDATFADGALSEQPRTSTPTGKKGVGKLLERMLADEGIAPIDEEESEDDELSIEDEHGFSPAEAITKTIEVTRSTRDDNTGSLASGETNEIRSGSSAALTTAEPTPAPPPKQKRTLASFRGSKKSLGYGLQPHPSSTPANAGFKSSFLNKSLRKAHTTTSSGGHDAEDDDDDDEEDDSMIGTKANTQANAAALLGRKKVDPSEAVPVVAPKASTTSVPASRIAGSKRKSDEMDEAEAPQLPTSTKGIAPKLARTLSDRSEPDGGQVPNAPKGITNPGSKIQSSKMPTASNLLRTKLESARLQKSTNPGAVGLGTRGLASPILGRAVPSSTIGTPEAESLKTAGTAQTSSAANEPATGPRLSGPSVASLRGQWEAKSQSTRTSPAKSDSSPQKSTSKIPAPTSTTPLNSPIKHVRNIDAQTAMKATTTRSGSATTKPASQPPAQSTLVDEAKAVEVQLGLVSPPKANTEVATHTVADKVSPSYEDHDETSTLNEEDGDADDESDDRDDDGRTSTKIMRPLSAAAQTAQAKSRATGSDGTSAHGTKSASYFSGKDHTTGSDADNDEFTLEELEGKNPTVGTSAASSSASAASTVVNKASNTTTTATTTNGTKPVEVAPASQWGHKLKSLFNINGPLPGVIGTSGPAPGSGFQPKTSRTLSGSVSAQKDVNASLATQGSSALNGSTLGGAGGSKPASIIRADQLRRKDAEEAERRMKEQDEKRRQLIASKAATQKAKMDEDQDRERKKRLREEEERAAKRAGGTSSQLQRPGQQSGGMGSTLGQPPKARLMSQFGGSTVNGGAAAGAKLKSSIAATTGNAAPIDDNGKKRRVSKERDEGGAALRQQPMMSSTVPPKAMTAASSTRPIGNGSSTNPHTGISRQMKPATTGVPRPLQQGQPSGFPRPPPSHQNTNFSQQNPFQQGQRPGGAGATASQLHLATGMPSHPIPPPSPAICIADSDMSLPSIVSEYSDSEDEATQARRARAAPWTKGEALHRALQKQAVMDADSIFGIPQGAVDLEQMMPAESAAAKARLIRPRTSSANWSGADGLAQWEIDRYNERMKIHGPGYKLPPRPSTVGAGSSTGGNGRLGPNGQDHRRSVLAIGAAAAARQQQQQQQHHQGQAHGQHPIHRT